MCLNLTRSFFYKGILVLQAQEGSAQVVSMFQVLRIIRKSEAKSNPVLAPQCRGCAIEALALSAQHGTLLIQSPHTNSAGGGGA